LIVDQENLSLNETNVIGIFCTKSPASVALALACISSRRVFAFCNLISENVIINEFDDLGLQIFFSDREFSDSEVLQCCSSFELFGKLYRLYKFMNPHKPVRLFYDQGDTLNRICYTVTTSGSTGKRKIVRVPLKCIKPNLISLQNTFKLRRDVIYASAPCTFDVFILDMLLSLYSGSTLLIINDNLRYSEKTIDLLYNSVTFMQMTPSIFRNYGEAIQNKIMHENSSLRYDTINLIKVSS
jgi:acyl-CoA synthetase (AMP-forming)/AMP-acid ligase II